MNAFIMAVGWVFNLYIMVVLLRFWLQLVKADFYNPFSQFIVKATNPLLRPLRKVIPGWGGIDIASVILAILLAFVQITLIQVLAGNGLPWLAIGLQSILTVINEAFSLVFYVLIIRAILSWVSQGNNPIEFVFHQLTEPMLAPIRRILPPMGGFDLSILVLIFALQFFKVLLVQDILPMF